MNVAFKEPGHRLHRRDQAAQMDRYVLPLQDHLGGVVEQRRGIVMRQIEHGRPRRLFQRQGHFALGGLKYAPNNR